MRKTPLQKALDVSVIGTFVLTIVIVVLMVIPLLWPSGGFAVPRGRIIGWVMPAILVLSIVLAAVLNFLAARTRHQPSPPRTEVPVPAPPRRIVAAPNSEEFAPKPPTVLSDKRILMHTTPLELLEFFKHNTSIQADTLLQPYIGKWMKISGAVNSVMHVLGKITQVSFSLDNGLVIAMSFAEDWYDAVSMLRKGANITVLGRLKSVQAIGIVSLENCELVS